MAIRNMSQQELAQKTGYSQSMVSLVCSGVRNPSTKAIRAYSEALNIPTLCFDIMAYGPKELEVLKNQKELYLYATKQILDLLSS